MSGEQALGDDLDDWLDARADELGTDRERLLARLVAAQRLALSETDERLAGRSDLESRVSALEEDLDEKIADVRERVVQIKRETDGKAPADHDHPDLADRLDGLAAEVETLRSEYDDLRASHERLRGDHGDLREDLDTGFENYELILDDLDSDTTDLAAKADTLARVALGLRDRIASLEGESAVRSAVADLQHEANRAGVSSAKCEDCGSSVHVGLLGAPTCPHCEATFDGVSPARGFFGSATLTTGERPALTDGRDEAAGPDGTTGSEGRTDEKARTADDLFAEDDDD
jgi:DNA repair exonuclease SbcCD ATPase subunit